MLRQSVSCHSPDRIRLWLQRVRGHLDVHRRVRPKLGGSHSNHSQIHSILLGGIQRWHTDLIMSDPHDFVEAGWDVRHALCSFASSNANFDSLRLPPVMIMDSTPARLERSSTWERSSAS